MNVESSKEQPMKYRLDDIDKKNKFEVPEGYFEDLPMKIQQRIEQEKKSPQTIQLPVWSMALAASILLILSFVFIFNENEQSAEELLAEISQEELIAYVDYFDLDVYDIASAFPEDAELIEFEEMEMLDGLDMEDSSLDEILNEYNLEDELLEI